MSLGIWGILGIVALVVVGVLLWLAGAYNSLVALAEPVQDGVQPDRRPAQAPP